MWLASDDGFTKIKAWSHSQDLVPLHFECCVVAAPHDWFVLELSYQAWKDRSVWQPPDFIAESLLSVENLSCRGLSYGDPIAGKMSTSVSGSDTEGSDTEGTSDKLVYSKARLEALKLLQTMAVKDAKTLHTFWTGLLPVYRIKSKNAQDATLMDILLQDPVSKVL